MEKNLLLLILIFSLIKADEEFIFSYKLLTKNSQTTNELFYITRAMTKTEKPTKELCVIKSKIDKQSTLSYLKHNRDELLKCFLKKGVIVNSFQKSTLKNITSQISIKTPPVRFTVKFNDGFGIISTFIEK